MFDFLKDRYPAMCAICLLMVTAAAISVIVTLGHEERDLVEESREVLGMCMDKQKHRTSEKHRDGGVQYEYSYELRLMVPNQPEGWGLVDGALNPIVQGEMVDMPVSRELYNRVGKGDKLGVEHAVRKSGAVRWKLTGRHEPFFKEK